MNSNRTDRYDVVIVGAGPAGSLLAYYLARKNISVLLIDRRLFPRYKACGGGITSRAMNLLPFAVDSVIDERIFSVSMRYQNQNLYDGSFDRPIISMVMRDRFDLFLIEKAIEAGATFRDQCSFVGISGDSGNLCVTTSSETVRAGLIAGCDGVNSRVSKALGLKMRRTVMTAVEGEYYPAKPLVLERFRHHLHYDFGVIPRGYGWVFPKKDHLSVGVGTFSSKPRDLLAFFNRYLELKGLNGQAKIAPLKGALIPVMPLPGTCLSTKSGLLAGDAAGLSDPLTAEGLYYAFFEARLAAHILEMELIDPAAAVLVTYTRQVAERLLADHVCAWFLSHGIYTFERLGRHNLTTLSSDLGPDQIAVITGSTNYRYLASRIVKNLTNPGWLFRYLTGQGPKIK